MHVFYRLMLALAASTLASGAFAQAWPTKPIRIVVPFPPGGGTNIIAREASQRVALATGWTTVIENKPGAGGNLGVDSVANAPLVMVTGADTPYKSLADAVKAAKA